MKRRLRLGCIGGAQYTIATDILFLILMLNALRKIPTY